MHREALREAVDRGSGPGKTLYSGVVMRVIVLGTFGVDHG